MKKLSKKAITGIFAAGLMAVIISISAFAAMIFQGVTYNLAAGATSVPILYTADENYMYFNTRPSSGAGGVNLLVSGPGVEGKQEFFPSQVSRPAWQIDTSKGIGNIYTVYLIAGSTDISGVLSVWTSAN